MVKLGPLSVVKLIKIRNQTQQIHDQTEKVKLSQMASSLSWSNFIIPPLDFLRVDQKIEECV